MSGIAACNLVGQADAEKQVTYLNDVVMPDHQDGDDGDGGGEADADADGDGSGAEDGADGS